MKKVFFLCVIFSIFLFSSCSLYEKDIDFNPSEPKKIFLKTISNETNKYGLEPEIVMGMSEEIQDDGRLTLVSNIDESDAVLSITVKRYILRPLTYDSNMIIEQYKMWIIADITLTDSDRGTEMFKEKIETIHIYLDANNTNADSSEAMTEAQAVTAAVEKLSRRITRRIISSFSSAKEI
jgi:hypothetical protein